MESINNQNSKDIEHLIIDGNSTDNTLYVIVREERGLFLKGAAPGGA